MRGTKARQQDLPPDEDDQWIGGGASNEEDDDDTSPYADHGSKIETHYFFTHTNSGQDSLDSERWQTAQ